jgi:HD-GYP domain-containing protein (c-di-GMP phosphodiesterase class II)
MSPSRRPTRTERRIIPRPAGQSPGRQAPDPDPGGHSSPDEPFGAPPASFFPISPESLRLETVTGFSLYLHHPKQNNYVLYRRGHLTFGEAHRERLRASRVKHLYIPDSQRGAYLRYVEQHLDQILNDPNLSREEKGGVLYASATHMVADIFSNPTVGANIRRTRAFIGSTVQHIVTDAKNVTALIELLDFDYSTFTHSVNVCVFGLALAARLGYDPAKLHDLGVGLMLHDLGKAKIDEEILFKPGPLNDGEWEVIRTHPDLGLELVSQAAHLSDDAAAVILQHHERCDGGGYPQQLTASEIHPFAKIAAVCDVFDALTTKRCYREAVPSYDAIFEMQRDMTGQLDSALLREMVIMMSPLAAQAEDGLSQAA